MLQRFRSGILRKLQESEQSVAAWFRTLSSQSTLGDAPQGRVCSFAHRVKTGEHSKQASPSRFKHGFECQRWPGFRGNFHTSPLSLSSPSEDAALEAAVERLTHESFQCMLDGRLDECVLRLGSSVTPLDILGSRHSNQKFK